MKDTQNIAIVLLFATAAILTAVLIVGYSSQEAYADTSVRQGDFMLLAGEITGDRDGLYLFNTRTKKMVLYDLNKDRREFVVVEQIDLGKLFSSR